MFKDKEGNISGTKITLWSVGGVVACIVAIFLISFVAGKISRYEAREDAKNEVTVTKTKIEKAREEAKVNVAQIAATKAEAKKRVAEAVGIKEAQVEINKTLTPLYVTHEFVQAIEKGNVEVSMIPVGSSGLPLVGNVLNSGSELKIEGE